MATNGVNGVKPLDWTTFHNTIDGKLTTTSKTRHSINPATGKPNPEVPLSTPEDVDKAMAAGKRAFRGWADTPWEKRKQAVLAFADAIEAEKPAFSKMLTQEQGKPVRIICPRSRVPDHLTGLASICTDGDRLCCSLDPEYRQP